MHSRFAALFLGLGIIDLGFVNLAVGPDVFDRAQGSTALGAPDAPAGPVVVIRQSQPSAPSSAPPSEAAPAPEPLRVEALPELPPAPLAPAATVSEPADDAEPVTARPMLAAESPIAEWTVQFPRANTADLPAGAGETLSAIAQRVQDQPGLRVRIVGHADARGTREHNLDLGGQRARAVAEALIDAGVPRERLVVKSQGEDEPRAAGMTERTWARNRRVEIAVHTPRSHPR